MSESGNNRRPSGTAVDGQHQNGEAVAAHQQDVANNTNQASISTTSSTSAPSVPLDIDSGVSNGDVDWLFRGKTSKKLAKRKTELNKELNLNFAKQQQLQQQHQQQQQKSAESKLTEQFKNASLNSAQKEPSSTDNGGRDPQQQATKTEPLKPALVNAHSTGDLKTASTPSAEAFKTHVNRTRSSSESRPPVSNSLPRNVVRRSSEVGGTPALTPSSSSGSGSGSGYSASASSAAANKKNIFSSLSSKFSSKSVSTSSSPSNVPGSYMQAAVDNGSQAPAAQPISQQAKKAPSASGTPATPPEQKGLFGLRRRLSVSKNPSSANQSVSASTSLPKSQAVPSADLANTASKSQQKSVPSFEGARLRRVTFALDILEDDPQQQIPSRNPKRGNVLVPEDILAEPARLSVGIADGTNAISSAKKQATIDKEELKMAYEAQKEALAESHKHAQEAHLAAQRMAKEVLSFKISNKTPAAKAKEEEDDVNFLHTPANLHKIDNALHHHIDYFSESQEDTTQVEPEHRDDQSFESFKELPLETIYTRCCHLREILPIPATLKQLKNKSKPLAVLKMLNPKPTLIDILSFSDFLAITPILTIIFDNVTIDSEMLKIVLSSISNSSYLEKLSLRNVAIDAEGWLYLCKFLSLSKSLIKLDISQQKIKADTPKHMHRSEMNWGIFTEALAKRGGLEELVINGCKLSDSQFSSLISNAVSLSTKRFGVASTNLNVPKAECLAQWITRPDSTCIGIDIAFNDMSQGQLQPFISSFNSSTKLALFSLNSTNATVADCEAMIKTLSTLTSLRFLDLSNIPHCFPAIISTLAEYLPKFSDLKRLHFELNELTAPELVAIANILPNCKSLIHVSFLGHKDINYATAVALYGAIKLSSVYTLDIDYDLIPEDLSSKIALYLMINMEKSMNKDLHFEYERSDEELLFDGSAITQAAENLLEAKTPIEQSQKRSEELYSKEIITKALIEKTTRVRKDIHKQMDKLFDMRMNGELSLEGKETLIRFCLLDNSLEKVVNIFEEEESQETPTVASNIAADIALAQEEHMHKVSSDILETGPIVSPNLAVSGNQQSYFSNLHNLPPGPTEHPHMVVTDSNKEGEDVAIDQSTGRPVLFRKSSHTSEHAKKQEEEEGEFHKWGFFIQNSLFPESAKKSTTGAQQQSPNVQAVRSTPNQMSPQLLPHVQPPASSVPSQSHTPQTNARKLQPLPTGAELRDMILKAKGSQKLNDLIDKFNYDHNKDIKIEDLYNTLNFEREQQQQQQQQQLQSSAPSPALAQQQHKEQRQMDDFPDLDKVLEGGARVTPSISHASPLTFNDSMAAEPGSPVSINSFELDEAYDKLLNEVDKVRSHKN